MDLQVKIHVSNDLKESSEVVERLVSENTTNKLDNYLAKFSKDSAEGTLEVKVDKNKKGLFNGVVHANFDGETYRSEREDFKNLDDLINHLFEHLKEQLSKK